MTTSVAPLRIGVLGCAQIARQFVRDARESAAVRFVAVASRDASRAQAFARDFGIPTAYGSYEALLADPAVDAIYNPLPNTLHAGWTIRAAQAGKHVLCEKPLATSLADARAMFNAARAHQVMLLEAYPYWFQPQTGDLVDLLRNGALGDVRSVQAAFGFALSKPDGNIRMAPDLGGGALLDAGSYTVSLVRLAMGSAPQQVLAQARWAGSGVDIACHGTLLWADGRVAQISCAMDAANHRRALIVGSAGTLETEFLNHTATTPTSDPRGYQPSQLRLRRGVANSVPFEERVCAVGSGFRFGAEAFAQLVAQADWAAMDRAAAASLDIAATLEALGRAARSGQIESVEPAR